MGLPYIWGKHIKQAPITNNMNLRFLYFFVAPENKAADRATPAFPASAPVVNPTGKYYFTECVNSSVARFARKFLWKFLLQFSSCLAAQQL